MSILTLLGIKKCTHERMSFNVDCGYCPDCGEYVENRWYLVRCSCCGVKRVAITRGNEILPKEHFCKNCGETAYYIEELKRLNIIDINYATVLRISPKPLKQNFAQAWVQETPEQKLLCGV